MLNSSPFANKLQSINHLINQSARTLRYFCFIQRPSETNKLFFFFTLMLCTSDVKWDAGSRSDRKLYAVFCRPMARQECQRKLDFPGWHIFLGIWNINMYIYFHFVNTLIFSLYSALALKWSLVAFRRRHALFDPTQPTLARGIFITGFVFLLRSPFIWPPNYCLLPGTPAEVAQGREKRIFYWSQSMAYNIFHP